MLEQEEKRGLVDPVGLGIGGGGGTELAAHAKRAKAKGVALVGRREGTVRVLNEEMADLVRVPWVFRSVVASDERRRVYRSDRICRR